ncbi:RagB/SusD family nutrient uptake outer membrane protein [Algoriphagus zhangzhouensis]|uniref:Starch-binding associating with outer membrane n=1 Tax=Algoriphagus zhangzhouensis TaxID=1073327 RepID=A0A1M7ZAN6_9BACT|nr:RagB/SusD family nutrient uptake outer membrane protein [Algoriphagus zhangzhouensis]TDY47169.1 putative outer membrane starch-binding protein [Algoriphagus zhangzhouensis]SHO61872.1 Starch-binding associating with outer membrane [Algoriphagus zhangzhouensis]
MKKYIVIIGAMFALSSCQEDFLDRYPQTSVAPEEFFKTEQDLELYVNGLLSMPGRGSFLDDQSSDNMATTAAVEIKNIMTGTPSSQTVTSGWNWGRLRNINYFLDNYGKAETSTSDEVVSHYVGLARYYRAYFYFDMVQRYSDVPWYDKTLNPGDEDLYKARDPRDVVMANVIEDLEFAVANVRESVPQGTPDLYAVKAFFARVALYEGTYRKYHSELGLEASADSFLQMAVDQATEIMESGMFSIYMTGNPQSDYGTLFTSTNLTGNPEVILNNAYDVNKDRSSDNNRGIFGDYEQSPSRDLVMTYLMADGTPYTDIDGYKEMTFVEEFQNRDPRLAQTVAYPGWILAPNSTPYIQTLNKNFTGYHQIKGYKNTVDNIDVASVDFAVYRYAEVLLTLAEAKAELNTLSQSDLDATINVLRTRAGMPALTMAEANANPDQFLVDKYSQVSGSNQGVLLEIRRERRIEMAMEGYRYDDLMRWNAGQLLAEIPQGMYFPGLGKYDMTGDGIEDIILINKDADIPVGDEKEQNSLGVDLIYYKAGTIDENVGVFLENGENGGNMVTETKTRTFEEPKYYYRPVPIQQVTLNPNLTQIFGWD